MHVLKALDTKDLQSIQGGLSWSVALTLVEILRDEIPDFIRGWRDYPKGRFCPPH